MKKCFFALVLTVYSSSSFAQDDEYCQNNVCTFVCGTNCTAILNQDTGHFKIEGSGNMKNFSWKVINGKKASDAPWQPYMQEIESVEISNDITSIGNGFLWGATNVQEVDIPENVTRIGNWAFLNTSLTSVEIPSKVEIIDSYAFAGTQISEIDIPDSVKEIHGYVFQQTPNLTEVDIPDTVETIGVGIFYMSGVNTVYCNNEGGRCDQFFYSHSENNLEKGILKAYTKHADRYFLDGLSYKSLENMKNNLPVKRIYTIDEANQVAGKTNTFSIRYR